MKTVDKECLREDIGCVIADIVPVLERIDIKFSNFDKSDLDVLEIKEESFSKILKYSKFLSEKISDSSNNDIKVSKPEIELITSLDISLSVDDMIKNLGLDWFNVHSCLDTIAGGMVPVLVGIAGAGKTYTAVNMPQIIWKFASDLHERTYDNLYKIMIPCSNISHNDFWGSFDAVSHICTGKFKYVWQEALNNPNGLYYVILDEMLDMYDIRKTFGDSFSYLTSLPSNIIIVATGNNDVNDEGRETANNIVKDSGANGRFDLIEVHNILQDKNSDDYLRFFNSIEVNSPLESKLKNLVLKYDEIYTDKMLVPRSVINFIRQGKQNMSEQDYFKLLSNNVKLDKDYIKKRLFVSLPTYGKDSIDDLEEIWNDI